MLGWCHHPEEDERANQRSTCVHIFNDRYKPTSPCCWGTPTPFQYKKSFIFAYFIDIFWKEKYFTRIVLCHWHFLERKLFHSYCIVFYLSFQMTVLGGLVVDLSRARFPYITSVNLLIESERQWKWRLSDEFLKRSCVPHWSRLVNSLPQRPMVMQSKQVMPHKHCSKDTIYEWQNHSIFLEDVVPPWPC